MTVWCSDTPCIVNVMARPERAGFFLEYAPAYVQTQRTSADNYIVEKAVHLKWDLLPICFSRA